MNLDATKKAYDEIFKALNKHKDLCIFDIERLEISSKLHLLGLELKEIYGLNIDPKSIISFDWIDCGEHRKIGQYGEKYNRRISWSDDGKQPVDEMLFCLKFPTGAYIFDNVNLFDNDYPTEFFNRFWIELKSYNPDYIDSRNHCMYWKISHSSDIFNSFDDILRKYYDLNIKVVKLRQIEKTKRELEKMQANYQKLK